MIFDILIVIATAVLGVVGWVLSTVTLIVPPQIQEKLIYAFGYLNIFKGVFPIGVLMACVSFVLYVYIGKYAIKLFFQYIFPFIPYFGKNNIRPFSEHTVDLRGGNQSKGNTLDARYKGRNIMRNTRDIR